LNRFDFLHPDGGQSAAQNFTFFHEPARRSSSLFDSLKKQNSHDTRRDSADFARTAEHFAYSPDHPRIELDTPPPWLKPRAYGPGKRAFQAR
jgi:hypothetical protein